jgi:hypothetical protein
MECYWLGERSQQLEALQKAKKEAGEPAPGGSLREEITKELADDPSGLEIEPDSSLNPNEERVNLLSEHD